MSWTGMPRLSRFKLDGETVQQDDCSCLTSSRDDGKLVHARILRYTHLPDFCDPPLIGSTRLQLHSPTLLLANCAIPRVHNQGLNPSIPILDLPPSTLPMYVSDPSALPMSLLHTFCHVTGRSAIIASCVMVFSIIHPSFSRAGPSPGSSIKRIRQMFYKSSNS